MTGAAEGLAYVSDVATTDEESMAMLWRGIDWRAAEDTRVELQRAMALATAHHDRDEQLRLQEVIVKDFSMRCLAVRDVSPKHTGPGVDKVRWTTEADRMRAVYMLRPDNYHARPYKQVDYRPKGGKERHIGLATMYDRAMSRLFNFALAPIEEVQADKKSFGFRKGRSAHDAHEWLRFMLTKRGDDGKGIAPSIVVKADVRCFYASVQHDWIMEHIPMNKHVLKEIVSAGSVYFGKLFPRHGEGMSEGCSIAPTIANFMLDGLQKHIYLGLHGASGRDVEDYVAGEMVRFADDMIVIVRSFAQGEEVLGLIAGFLAERGLELNDEKTGIYTLAEGFDFLGRTYELVGGHLRTYPSREVEERFIRRLAETVERSHCSQRDLIGKLNDMLNGWANYYRYSDALECFRRVDAALDAVLLKTLRDRHPKTRVKDLIDQHFVESKGHHHYCLRSNANVRVVRLGETVLAHHERVKCSLNAYLDPDYVEGRTHDREIAHVTGRYKAVWRRQGGLCHHCKESILVDQPKIVVPIDVTKQASIGNLAYVHLWCANDEYQVIYMDEPLTSFIPYDYQQVLEEVEHIKKLEATYDVTITHAHLPEDWVYWPLKAHFAGLTAASATMTFKEMEKILGRPLPKAARTHKAFWYEREGSTREICRAWKTEGYEMADLNLKREKVKFKRERADYVHAYLPREITEQRIPDDAAYKLNLYAEGLVKEYGLKLPR